MIYDITFQKALFSGKVWDTVLFLLAIISQLFNNSDSLIFQIIIL